MTGIIITYWEGDEGKDRPFTKIEYVEWEKDRKSYFAHADESKFNLSEDTDRDEVEGPRGHWEHRGIPDDVRETLALLIAPSLRKAAP